MAGGAGAGLAGLLQGWARRKQGEPGGARREAGQWVLARRKQGASWRWHGPRAWAGPHHHDRVGPAGLGWTLGLVWMLDGAMEVGPGPRRCALQHYPNSKPNFSAMHMPTAAYSNTPTPAPQPVWHRCRSHCMRAPSTCPPASARMLAMPASHPLQNSLLSCLAPLNPQHALPKPSLCLVLVHSQQSSMHA